MTHSQNITLWRLGKVFFLVVGLSFTWFSRDALGSPLRFWFWVLTGLLAVAILRALASRTKLSAEAVQVAVLCFLGAVLVGVHRDLAAVARTGAIIVCIVLVQEVLRGTWIVAGKLGKWWDMSKKEEH